MPMKYVATPQYAGPTTIQHPDGTRVVKARRRNPNHPPEYDLYAPGGYVEILDSNGRYARIQSSLNGRVWFADVYESDILTTSLVADTYYDVRNKFLKHVNTIGVDHA